MNYKRREERAYDNSISLASIKRRLAAFVTDCVFIVIVYFLVLLAFSIFSVNDWNINVVSIFEVDVETTIKSRWFVILL